MMLILFVIFLPGCSSYKISKDEKFLYKQIKNLEIEDVKRLEPTLISNLQNERTNDYSQILDIQITPKNYKVGKNYIEAALSIWDYLYSVDNQPIKIGSVRVHGRGDVFFADVAEKYVVISRDQYEWVKDLPKEEAYKYFPIYQGYSAAEKRLLPCIEGFCNDEDGKNFEQSYKFIFNNLKNGQYIDFIEKDQSREGIYWFFIYEFTEKKQKYSNDSIWNDDHNIYSIGVYDEKSKQILDIKKVHSIKNEIIDWFKIRKGEYILAFNNTYFYDKEFGYIIDFYIGDETGYVSIPIGLDVVDNKIELIMVYERILPQIN
jgi:hypothetical protein